MKIKIGTRGSKLAIIQTKMVIDSIKHHFPSIECVVTPIVTTGDKITDKNLYDIGGKALFLKELEEHLLDQKIDIAVHSFKDVPGILSDDLSIAAVLERGDSRDCFISLKYKSIEDLPKNATVGTSSVRRKVLLHAKRPDLNIVPFRGNINTRLAKLQRDEVDATILANVGLIRANLFDNSYCHPLDVNEMLPAAGQGIIGIEIRKNDKKMKEICDKINHMPTWYLSLAERSFLSYLDATCDTPISAFASFDKEGKIEARYMLSDFDGHDVRYHKEVGDIRLASNMGIAAAKKIKYP
ncbi:hydroxymethylbilane synthase [Rickettsiaceae bacterium]|nr:hydroxymethylbilane synthase [Rickettsiaceae bacterium]